MTRDELQESVKKWLKETHRVALYWATSVGKSRAALLCVPQVLDEVISETNEEQRVLIVVAERAHILNWREEINKWIPEYDEFIDIVCYNSIKKYIKDYELVIFDECHHIGTDIRMNSIEEFRLIPNVIMLSATPDKEASLFMDKHFGKFKVSHISIDKAIEMKWLPSPTIICIELELNNKLKNIEWYYRGDSKSEAKGGTLFIDSKDKWKYLKDPRFKNCYLTSKITEEDAYKEVESTYNYWHCRRGSSRGATMCMKAAISRKKFLGELKTGYVRQILKVLDKDRYICFCSSVNQSIILNKAHSINSKVKNSLAILNRFNTKKISNLFCVGMITEGQNLTDIQKSVIIQLDASTRLFVQKIGRELRAEYPVQYIFYYKNTRDEKFLEDALENISNSTVLKIKFSKLNEWMKSMEK